MFNIIFVFLPARQKRRIRHKYHDVFFRFRRIAFSGNHRSREPDKSQRFKCFRRPDNGHRIFECKNSFRSPDPPDRVV